jgi:hypothetical protein
VLTLASVKPAELSFTRVEIQATSHTALANARSRIPRSLLDSKLATDNTDPLISACLGLAPLDTLLQYLLTQTGTDPNLALFLPASDDPVTYRITYYNDLLANGGQYYVAPHTTVQAFAVHSWFKQVYHLNCMNRVTLSLSGSYDAPPVGSCSRDPLLVHANTLTYFVYPDGPHWAVGWKRSCGKLEPCGQATEIKGALDIIQYHACWVDLVWPVKQDS